MLAGGDGEGNLDQATVAGVLDHMADQVETMQALLERSDAGRTAVNERLEALAGAVDGWHLAGTLDAGPRGQGADALAARLHGTPAANGALHVDLDAALAAALLEAAPDGRVLAFGSFHAAAQALRYLNATN